MHCTKNKLLLHRLIICFVTASNNNLRYLSVIPEIIPNASHLPYPAIISSTLIIAIPASPYEGQSAKIYLSSPNQHITIFLS